jgi:hypothetical protein
MWLWEIDLRRLGFRRKAERYWQCRQRFGLAGDDHISIYSWSEQQLPGPRFLVELTEFHVTFAIGNQRVHFYYHEAGDHIWEPGGHTSANEIRLLDWEPNDLRKEADAVAQQLILELGGTLAERDR